MKKKRDLPAYIYIHTASGKKRRWRLIWLPKGHPLLEGALGRIESPEAKGKRLFIQMGQEPDELFDTLLHEMGHGAGWNLDEDWIKNYAKDATRNMKALGYEFRRIR